MGVLQAMSESIQGRCAFVCSRSAIRALTLLERTQLFCIGAFRILNRLGCNFRAALMPFVVIQECW